MSQSDFVNRGQDLVAAGKFQEAVKVCRLGLLGRPAIAEGRVVLGQALRGLGRYDEVIAEMRVALDLDPTLLEAHILRGEALLHTGEVHASIEALQRARRLAPSDSRVNELLREAEHSAGGRPESSGDDTVKRPAPQTNAGAVPQPVDGGTSDAIEVDPEVEGVEVLEDFNEAGASPAAQPSVAAVASAPIKAGIPVTIALPAPAAPGAVRPGSPTRPPPGAPAAPAAASRPEVKSGFPATLALPSMFEPSPPSRGAGPQPPQQYPVSVQPTLAFHAEPPMSPAQQQAAVSAARLFADSGPSQRGQAMREPPPPLNMTLAGVGGPGLQPSPPVVPPPTAAFAAPHAAPPTAAFAASHAEPSAPAAPAAVKRSRSRFRTAMWLLVGTGLIGVGLVAGFQIRAMRLNKQIEAAQARVREETKSDTWAGWVAAASSLGAVADAAGTAPNRAALARARALIAFEFGDGQVEAERLVESLGGAGGLDGTLAASYVALARGDANAAKQAAAAATALAGADPAAMYVASQAALINGDFGNATTLGKSAVAKEGRRQYAIGLARVYAAASAWGDAQNALQRVLASEPDHPSAVIERGLILAVSGRVAPGAGVGREIRGQIEKLIAQPRLLSLAQAAFAHLVLARIDFARNEVVSARSDVESAAKVGLDDQRLAEAAVETLYALGDVALAQKTAKSALASWPASRRSKIVLAQIALVQGRANDALQIAREADLTTLPLVRALLGQARLATGDLDGARKDLDAALKAAPHLDQGLVGRVWLDITSGQSSGDAAKKIAERVASGAVTPAVAIAHAAALRSSGDLGQRDQARQLLEAVISGAPGPDLARAHVEVARIYRDSGDFEGARKSYSDASARGSVEARLENAVLAIDNRDPKGGAAALNALLKELADRASAALITEVVRARILSGDHAGAATLIETAAKLPGVVAWKIHRERGRLALRRGDVQAATTALGSALKECKNDPETFLLGADAAGASATPEFSESFEVLYRERLGESAEALLVAGKLLLAAGNTAKAEKAYTAARDALKTSNASPRRVAQANFGLAVIAYGRRNDTDALAKLNVVITDDPAIYDAYLFKADIIRDRNQALEQARLALQFNPDYPRAWFVLGKSASALGDRATLADAVAKLQILAPGSPELAQLAAL